MSQAIEPGRPLKIALLADVDHVNVRRWCEGLAGAGAEMHVISFSAAATDFAGAQRVYRLKGRALPGKAHYALAMPAVRRLLRTIKPDLLAAYYITGYGFLGALTGFRPLVLHSSGSDVLLAPSDPTLRRVLDFSLKRAALTTAWAPHMGEAVRAMGVDEERIMVLPRGIPVADFARVQAKLPSSGEPLRLISTRRLHPAYNIELLVRAVAKVREHRHDLRLTLAGDGPLRGSLESLAVELKLGDNVHFAGRVGNDDLPKLLAEHHFYSAQVPTEGVSASLLEAMAVGLVPLVPDNPGNRHWIRSGENAWLLDDLTPEGVAGVLELAIAGLKEAPDKWRAAAQENIARIRNEADYERNAQRYMERFRSLIAPK